MRNKYELAQIIEQFGSEYITQCKPNSFIVQTLEAIRKCRTSALGGHKDKCDCCGKERISYNSCRNRHCPKCQGLKQALWVEERMQDAFPVSYYHVVFTVPDALNEICLLDSKAFYNNLFDCSWETLKSFGQTNFASETGAISVLHTWGQNLSLHPHIHCIVPSVGLNYKGNIASIGKQKKYLYPVKMMSVVFRAKMLTCIKKQLNQKQLLQKYRHLLDEQWKKPWVVYCKAPFGTPEHVIKYLGQYTHRIAISNNRILSIDKSSVAFSYKDYRYEAIKKSTKLNGVEFLRRFSQHILPYRFVKIRHYGILSSKNKHLRKLLIAKIKPSVIIAESIQQKVLRLLGFDIYKCPFCKEGIMHKVETLPKIRSPPSVLYKTVNY